MNKIIKAITLFIIIFATTSLIMTQIITMDRYILNMLFLLAVSLIIIFCFKKTLMEVVSKTHRYEFIFIFMFSLIIHVVSSYFILSFLNQPVWPFDSRGTSFLLMNKFYLWVKPLDVFVQQLLIIVLVKKLYQYKLSLRQITILFICGFGLIHIFQVFKTSLIIGLGFTFVAMLSSLVYPYMILKVRNGYLYNYMIHLGIYNIVALTAWIFF